mmetsp:Transcript_23194/g.49292  ORF Transcript_23194/g.49292 Transcript_23194/m.49292 type:complete len:84 (+) Transcript_23194:191-442(+)
MACQMRSGDLAAHGSFTATLRSASEVRVLPARRAIVKRWSSEGAGVGRRIRRLIERRFAVLGGGASRGQKSESASVALAPALR